MSYRIEAIPASELERIRTTGQDETGNAGRIVVDDGRHPLRCCLRASQPSERIMLIAYTPPGTAGPYAERGPVFVHAEACGGFVDQDPLTMASGQQVVRGYDHDGNMAESTVVPAGEDTGRELAALAERPHISVIHVRNAAAGCFNFAAWPEH